MLVEDFRPLQESLARGLRESGLSVDVSGDGEEGLWFARSHDFDVVILDLMLPGLDGWTVLERLRAEGSEVPVLILTAKSAVEDRVRGLDLGADDYLTKPFSIDELLARVRVLLRRRYKVRNPKITIADLEIDTARQRVLRGGQDIALTAREYALLHYLALRRGEVVSRSEIWEHIYEFDSSASSNVVDVYISFLRKKTEGQGRPRLIHTHRGRGYSLEAPE